MLCVYVHRLAKGHLEATVKHVFKNTTADDLSKSYDDFFLSKADDIADQLKTAPGVNDFEAHQMVSDMVQVSGTHTLQLLCTYMYTCTREIRGGSRLASNPWADVSNSSTGNARLVWYAARMIVVLWYQDSSTTLSPQTHVHVCV